MAEAVVRGRAKMDGSDGWAAEGPWRPLSSPTIVLCEPQWTGLMHASFNAALLESVRAALPGWRVILVADSSHSAAIKEALSLAGRNVEGLEVLDSEVRHSADWGRRAQGEPIWRLRQIVRSRRPRVVILASVTAMQIAVAKLAFGTLASSCRVLAFLHENAISAFTDDGSSRFLKAGMLRSLWNQSSWPRGLAFAAFGERVLVEVRRGLPKGSGARIAAVRPPCLLDAPPTEDEVARRWHAREIVLVGNTYKGRLEEFLRAAWAVRESSPDVRFVLAGGLGGADGSQLVEAKRLFGDEVGMDMLPRDTYRRLLCGATFGVVHVDAANYRARISAGTLDTFSACLPSAIRSMPFNDSCVEDDALPAVLYRDTRSLESALKGFVAKTSVDDYRRDVAAIERGRRVFSPGAVGSELRALLRDFLDVRVEP